MLHFNLIGIIKKIQQREVQFPIYLLSKNQTRVVETLAQDTTEMPASPIRIAGSSTSYPTSRQSSCQQVMAQVLGFLPLRWEDLKSRLLGLAWTVLAVVNICRINPMMKNCLRYTAFQIRKEETRERKKNVKTQTTD